MANATHNAEFTYRADIFAPRAGRGTVRAQAESYARLCWNTGLIGEHEVHSFIEECIRRAA